MALPVHHTGGTGPARIVLCTDAPVSSKARWNPGKGRKDSLAATERVHWEQDEIQVGPLRFQKCHFQWATPHPECPRIGVLEGVLVSAHYPSPLAHRDD